jgi:hypothetical protein
MSKIRVYELAKELGIANKDLISKAQEGGFDVPSHLTNLEVDTAEGIRALFAPPPKASSKPRAPKPAPAAPAEETKRRTRGKKAAEAAPAESAAAEPAPSEPAAEIVSGERKRRRTRTKPVAAAAEPVVEAAPVEKAEAAAAAPAAAPAEGEKKRRRRRKKKTGDKAAAVTPTAAPLVEEPSKAEEPPTATAEEPADKPRRTRSRKPELSLVPDAEDDEPKAKRAPAPPAPPREEIVLKPGQVVDLRAAHTREAMGKPKPKPTAPARPVSSEPVALPKPGEVLDLRAKRNAGAAQAGGDSRGRGGDRDRDRDRDRGKGRDRDRDRGRDSDRAPREERKPLPEAKSDDAALRRTRRRDEGQGAPSRKPAEAPHEMIPETPELQIPDLSAAAPQAAVDITVAVLATDVSDTAATAIRAVIEQELPWEREVMAVFLSGDPMAQTIAREFDQVRVVELPRSLDPARVLDKTTAEAQAQIVVFLAADFQPRTNRWLVQLTDPLFEDEGGRVAVVDGFALHDGEEPPRRRPRTYRRSDNPEHRNDIDATAFAARKKTIERVPFASVAGPKAWMEAVFEAGFERRNEPGLVVDHIQAAAAAEAPKPTPAKEAPKKHAPKPEAPKAEAPKAPKPEATQPPKAAPPRPEAPRYTPPPPPVEPPPEMWQIPGRIAAKTAERIVHVVTGIEERSLKKALRAPLDAAAEVLESAGIPLPKFLRKRR